MRPVEHTSTSSARQPRPCAGRPRDRSLLNPVDGERLRLACLRREFHLLARLGRGHRFDRLEVGLGHDLEDALDLRMKVRHDTL